MTKSLMTRPQMAQALAERPNRRLNYKQESDTHKGEMLAANIQTTIEALERTASRERVNLYDVDQVKIRTLEYLQACKTAEAFPSVMGLAAFGFGYSRQGLNKFLRQHPNEASAQFIELVKDSFADVLTNQSLYRNADAAQAIFQLKNHNDFADRLQLEPITTENPLGPEPNQAALEARIEGIVIDD